LTHALLNTQVKRTLLTIIEVDTVRTLACEGGDHTTVPRRASIATEPDGNTAA